MVGCLLWSYSPPIDTAVYLGRISIAAWPISPSARLAHAWPATLPPSLDIDVSVQQDCVVAFTKCARQRMRERGRPRARLLYPFLSTAWCRRSTSISTQGHAEATFYLAQAYRSGSPEMGLPQDLRAFGELVQRAAADGSSDALYALGGAFFHGEDGFARDPRAAFRCAGSFLT